MDLKQFAFMLPASPSLQIEGKSKGGKGKNIRMKVRINKSQTQQSVSGILRGLQTSVRQCTSDTVCGVTGIENHGRNRSGMDEAKILSKDHE